MSTATYPLRLERGHLIVNVDEQRFIVDTGSPLTFVRGGRLRLAGKACRLPTSELGMDADNLGELSGLQIDGLLGLDQLGPLDVVFDVADGVLELHTERLERPPAAATVRRHLNLPLVEVECGGRVCRAFLDSAAQYSYLPPGLGEGGVGEEVDDFHPFLGRFRVVLRDTTGGLRVGGLVIPTHRHAAPTESLEATMSLAGVEGIVGTPLFTQGRMALSMRGGWFGELPGLAARSPVGQDTAAASPMKAAATG